MSTPRFHCDAAFTAGTRVRLPDDVFHHATRVRRLRVGDDIVLFAGDGAEAAARIAALDRGGADVDILGVAHVDRESPLAITLVQGISSGERMDYTLQKAVELGASAIVPVFVERSIVRLAGERADKRLAHWREIVASACEQCGRNRIPEVSAAASFAEAIPRVAAHAALRYVLSVDGGARLRALPAPQSGLALLAGPEGGLTPGEERAARAAGFAPISLGPRVLRTETAAVAAMAAMQALWGDG